MIFEFILKWEFWYELIKDVKILLILGSGDDSWLLKQIIVEMSMFNL